MGPKDMRTEGVTPELGAAAEEEAGAEIPEGPGIPDAFAVDANRDRKGAGGNRESEQERGKDNQARVIGPVLGWPFPGLDVPRDGGRGHYQRDFHGDHGPAPRAGHQEQEVHARGEADSNPDSERDRQNDPRREPKLYAPQRADHGETQRAHKQCGEDDHCGAFRRSRMPAPKSRTTVRLRALSRAWSGAW